MDILNLNPDDFIAQSAQKVRVFDENIYDPDVSKAPNGVYKAVIRFIPWHAAKNVDEIRYKKYTVRLVNPLTNEKLWIDDPSTVGKSSVFWNIETRLKNLEKEEPELVKEIKKNFQRSYKFFSLAYIKKDPQNPALEGKIKVFPYGFTIWNMGEQLLNPPDADLGTGVKVNPFALDTGRDFIFMAKKKTQQWRDFSGSKFIDTNSPLIVKSPNGNEVAYSTDPAVQEKFISFLKKNSPDLSQYFFKEWVESDYTKVVQFLIAAIPYKQILDDAFNQCRDEKIKEIYASLKSGVASTVKATTQPQASGLDDLDSDLTFVSNSAPAVKNTETVQVASSEDDDMFAGL